MIHLSDVRIMFIVHTDMSQGVAWFNEALPHKIYWEVDV